MSRNHRAENIKVPKIHWNFTRTAVLTMEWVDGIKLTDEITLKRASLDRRDLIDQVKNNCYLIMLGKCPHIVTVQSVDKFW